MTGTGSPQPLNAGNEPDPEKVGTSAACLTTCWKLANYVKGNKAGMEHEY